MAELAMAAAGLVLAWKSILDFGELVRLITDDDASSRDGLLTRLRVSSFMLQDWNYVWGVDRQHGRFHSLEPDRQELIVAIIFRLRDSRLQALKRLKDHYGLSTDTTNNAATGHLDVDRLSSRIIAKTRSASTKLRHKGRWLVADKATVNALVEETFQQHRNLQDLTFNSATFVSDIISHLRAHPQLGLQTHLDLMDSHERDLSHRSQRALRRHPASPSSEASCFDEQTLASYAAKSIPSSYQAETLQSLISRSFHFRGDARIPGVLSLWWNESCSRLLILELPDIAGDQTSAMTCAMVYYLASCNKLIYYFDWDASANPVDHFTDLLRTLTRTIISLHGSDNLEGIASAAGLSASHMDVDRDSDPDRLLRSFQRLLSVWTQRSEKPILVIVDGLQHILFGHHDILLPLIRSFVAGLYGICTSSAEGQRGSIKVLLGLQGNAIDLYDCVGEQDVVNMTDRPSRTSTTIRELALTMQDCPGLP